MFTKDKVFKHNIKLILTLFKPSFNQTTVPALAELVPARPKLVNLNFQTEPDSFQGLCLIVFTDPGSLLAKRKSCYFFMKKLGKSSLTFAISDIGILSNYHF